MSSIWLEYLLKGCVAARSYFFVFDYLEIMESLSPLDDWSRLLLVCVRLLTWDFLSISYVSAFGMLLKLARRSAYFLSSVYGLFEGSKFFLSPAADFKKDRGEMISAAFLESIFCLKRESVWLLFSETYVDFAARSCFCLWSSFEAYCISWLFIFILF